MKELEQRIAAIEARIEISELRARYGWYATRGMNEEIASLFTEDGSLRAITPEGRTVDVTGRANLAKYFSTIPAGRRVPLITNEVIHIDGDEAEGTCAMQVPEPRNVGHYVDHFRKVNGRWLFKTRLFHNYWPQFTPSPDRLHP